MGIFIGLDIHIINLVSILFFFIFLSLLNVLPFLLEMYIVPLLATSGFIIVTSGVSEMPALAVVFYSIFTRHILYSSGATCRLPPTLIIYEPKNSVRKPESTNRVPLTLTMYDFNISDCEPKTPNHCLGPKVHHLNLELVSI